MKETEEGIVAPWTAWGLAPDRVERPKTPTEAAECLRAAADRGETVIPIGAGTSLAAGGIPGAARVALSLEDMSDLVEYAPGDLTVTALAGTPIRMLQDLLEARGQWLPGTEGTTGTIGGLLASGHSAAASREVLGSLRERLLGAQVAGADGTLTRSGGRVVKNVTGLDLHRMHAGAGGALGVLTEICFRVEPRPEARVEVELESPSWVLAEEAWRWLRHEGPETTCVRAHATPTGEPVLRALFLGDSEPAREAADRLLEGWGSYGAARSEPGTEEGRPAPAFDPAALPAHIGVRVYLAPSVVLAAHEALRVSSAARGLHVESWSYPNLGEIELSLSGKPEDVVDAWAEIAEAARRRVWRYRIEDESAGLPSPPPAWSGDPLSFRLLARLKHALDPAGLLHPGSYSVDALRAAAEYFGR